MFNLECSKYNSELAKTETWLETRGIGSTLRVWVGDIQVMSDVWDSTTYAEYWDGEKIVQCAWTKDAVVDATPEVLTAVKEFRYQRNYTSIQCSMLKEANRIKMESEVRVIRGKTSVGTEGVVRVIIQRPYGMGYRASMENKLGISLDDETVMVKGKYGNRMFKSYKNMVWVWERNCELKTIPAIDNDGLVMRARGETLADMRKYEKKAA
jgi:hypothetical protein